MPTKRSLDDTRPGPQNLVSLAPSLRPILPKKGWKPLARPLPVRGRQIVQQNEPQSFGGCLIPQCRRLDCNLRTHLQHELTSRSSTRSSSPPSTIDATNSAVGGGEQRAWEHNALMDSTENSWRLPRNILHGLEGLPDSISETPIFRELFNDFFDRMFDRFQVLFRPPPLNAKGKKDRLVTAMSSPVYCMNAIATASFDRLMHQKLASGDRTATILYGKAMSMLRTQIATFDNSRVEHLLMIMMTLALFDLAHHNTAFFSVHRQGMQQLVSRIGGLHNLQHSLPSVLALDRIISVYTGALPLYARPIDSSIQKPSRYPEQYASYFESDEGRDCLDEEVCKFCCEVSRTLELFEGANISYDPAIANVGPVNGDLTYFYFSRERVANRFTQLNHKYWDTASRSRCVALATKIVDYVILWDNYITVIPEFLALKLKETLDRMEEELDNEWANHVDLLSWILFVILTMPDRFGHGEWAFEWLRKIWGSKYEGSYRKIDWLKELENTKRFVWCSRRLDQAFSKACEELAQYFAEKTAEQEQGKSDDFVTRRSMIDDAHDDG